MLLSYSRSNTVIGTAKQFLSGRQKGSEEDDQPTTNKNDQLQPVVSVKGKSEQKDGGVNFQAILFLHTISRSCNVKGWNCVSVLRGAKTKQTLWGRRAKAGTTENRSLLAAGRTRNYQIWIKMTLEESEKNLLLRWSRIILSSPESWRGRKSAKGAGGTLLRDLRR